MSTRKEILDAAKRCVCGDREQDYGSPENNFQTIADLWNAYLKGGKKTAIDAVDVAAMLALLKIARIGSGHAKQDNWVDLAGYAACGGEIQSTIEQSRRMSQSDLNRSESPASKPTIKHEPNKHCTKGVAVATSPDEPVKRYSPCIVWVFDDDSWTWDLEPTFGLGGKYLKRNLVAMHHDCTVEIVRLPNGEESKGWWRNEAPPIDLSNIWVTDDDDCD